MRQFANVRTKTVKLVTTYDLMMACAKHHNLTGDAFKAQISDFWGLLDQVHAALINDLIPSHKEAASWPLEFAAGGIDINMYAWFACKALEKRGETASALCWWFNDIFEATRFSDTNCPLNDHYVIVNHLPAARAAKGFTL